MKFIGALKAFSGETIYNTDGVEVVFIYGQKYRYLVSIFDARFFVFSETEVAAHDVLDFVMKNNPHSGYYLLGMIIADAMKRGEERGREELRSELRKLLNP